VRAKIEKVKKKNRKRDWETSGIDWLARWRAWPRWMTLYFPRVHLDYGLKSGHKSSWILYRYVPAGGTAGRERKFHRGIAPRERKEMAGKWERQGNTVGRRGKRGERLAVGLLARGVEKMLRWMPQNWICRNVWLSATKELCVIIHLTTLLFLIFLSFSAMIYLARSGYLGRSLGLA